MRCLSEYLTAMTVFGLAVASCGCSFYAGWLFAGSRRKLADLEDPVRRIFPPKT